MLPERHKPPKQEEGQGVLTLERPCLLPKELRPFSIQGPRVHAWLAGNAWIVHRGCLRASWPSAETFQNPGTRMWRTVTARPPPSCPPRPSPVSRPPPPRPWDTRPAPRPDKELRGALHSGQKAELMLLFSSRHIIFLGPRSPLAHFYESLFPFAPMDGRQAKLLPTCGLSGRIM